MKPLIFVLGMCLVTAVTVRAQETLPGGATIQSAADIPEGYGRREEPFTKRTVRDFVSGSRGTDSAELPPNLLVCLKPYLVLTRIGTEGGRWQGARATNRWRSGTATQSSRSGLQQDGG